MQQDLRLLLLVIALAGLGTYLIRVLPMRWHERGQAKGSKTQSVRMLALLQAIGPAAIVALLCISLADLIAKSAWLSDSVHVLLGLIGVVLGHRWAGIALGTLLGVLCYGLSVALI